MSFYSSFTYAYSYLRFAREGLGETPKFQLRFRFREAWGQLLWHNKLGTPPPKQAPKHPQLLLDVWHGFLAFPFLAFPRRAPAFSCRMRNTFDVPAQKEAPDHRGLHSRFRGQCV